jgi:hypothetical protein
MSMISSAMPRTSRSLELHAAARMAPRMAECRRGSDSKLWNVSEVLGRRNMEVPVCSPWLTLVGEAAEAVTHRDILTVLAACLVGR